MKGIKTHVGAFFAGAVVTLSIMLGIAAGTWDGLPPVFADDTRTNTLTWANGLNGAARGLAPTYTVSGTNWTGITTNYLLGGTNWAFFNGILASHSP